jgi:hypothetical protein
LILFEFDATNPSAIKHLLYSFLRQLDKSFLFKLRNKQELKL